MTNANDTRILELKKQIEIKKENLGKSTRFTPITNCSLDFKMQRYNLNALGKHELTSLLIELNLWLLSAKELGVDKTFELSGYKLEEWITDGKSKLEILNRKEEELQLKKMEDKLVKLLSDRKKVELEIDEIESLLND